MKWSPKVYVPLLVLGIGVVGAVALIKARSVPRPRPSNASVPLVRVVAAHKQDLQLKVETQGTVVPRTESALVPEISGRVVSVSPAFAAGGFFEKGEVLLTIDPRDYELAVTRARAEVARERVRYESERAEAEVAGKEWKLLGEGEASPLTLREPQLEEAKASYEAARAALEQAELDLERTRVRAPFWGRVKEKSVDVGQFVQRGVPAATIYAVDFAEIRLPLPPGEVAYVDLPLHRDEEGGRVGPRVDLHATFAGRELEWEGKIVRTEGQIDPRTRMVYAVAQVENPYGLGTDGDRPPLAAGLFVQAEVYGKIARDVFVLPRAAVRGKDRVLVVDDEKRLRFRRVDILRAQHEEVVVRAGLEEGELVCVSPLETVVDGMRVRTILEGELQGEANLEEAQAESPPESGVDP